MKKSFALDVEVKIEVPADDDNETIDLSTMDDDPLDAIREIFDLAPLPFQREIKIEKHAVNVEVEILDDLNGADFIEKLRQLSKKNICDEHYYSAYENKFLHSPFLPYLSEFMAEMDQFYPDCFISHWLNRDEQFVHFCLRQKTWLERQYDRQNFIGWLKEFLPDFQEDVRKIENDDTDAEIYLLGFCHKLNVAAIETNKDVSIGIMRYIAKEHSISNFFEVSRNSHFAYTEDKWWKLKFWWSKFEITKTGHVRRKQLCWEPAKTITWHYFGDKKIIPTTYDITDDKDFYQLVHGYAESIDDIVKMMNVKSQLIPPEDYLNYKNVDYFTNINPTDCRIYLAK